MAFYNKLGFQNHPFTKSNADEEPWLEKYFVPPPYFDAVKGDKTHPNSTVVVAPRGGGKTAQKRMVENWSKGNDILAVTYDRFEFANMDIDEIDLNYHIKNIMIRVLVVLYSELSENPDSLKSLTKEERKQLSLFSHIYLGDISGAEIREILNELKGIPQKLHDFWKDNVKAFEEVVTLILSYFGLPESDSKEKRETQKKLDETNKFQLIKIFEIANKLGYKSIYVLIDKVDETEYTGNDPENSYKLVESMLRDLELLGLKGYGFKFFLWDKIEDYYKEHARPDRIDQHHLNWNRSQLESTLTKRLQAYSNNAIKNFNDICSIENDFDIHATICLIANKSPRNVVRICNSIFASHADNSPEENKIDLYAVDSGIQNYCKQILSEHYSDDLIKELQRGERDLFTINYYANEIFKTHANSVRNKVKKWKNEGAISQIGTLSKSTSKKPLNFYYVVDPALKRLVYREKPLEEFIKDFWITCSRCKEDHIMNIELFVGENEPLCNNCGRNLF